MVDYEVWVVPGKCTIFCVIVSPRKKFDYPASSHQAYKFQASLYLPGFNFVGQPCVDAQNQVIATNRLGVAESDKIGRRLKRTNDKQSD
jgi:hypothetical protein